MVTPGSRQAKGYAIQICVVLSKVPGLELGESNPFPIHRVLTERTVHRFVHINEQIGMEKAAGSTPVKKTVKKPVSNKRPAASETEVAPIAKKNRTTKGKPAAMALEAVPLQTIEPTADVPAEQPPVPTRKSRKRRLEISNDVPASEEQPAADPDHIIEQILIQLDTTAATQGDKTETWFDRAFDEEFATTEQENQDSEEEIVFDVAKTGEEASSRKHHSEELMSLDDLLIQISEDTMLPSVTAAEITKIRLGESINIQEVQEQDVYYASLPRISIHDKGKEPLVEDDPVKGNPARESVELICGDVEFLVRLRDQVMVDVVEFFHSFSLNKLPDSDSLKTLKEKEKLMLEWAGTDSLETAVNRRVYILAKYREMLLRNFWNHIRNILFLGSRDSNNISNN
ncbi:TMV resistance protein N [Dorcoceras hygrometricum]|uniref:TMV resistance protein N n=1 Tax=Dorcoceras hygrometricum TaxID=472368 RepID=A0A2Z7AW84_9LAMI|nr:TMV resistance protein N [Dorcoceras hygrometricum]